MKTEIRSFENGSERFEKNELLEVNQNVRNDMGREVEVT